MGTAEVGAVGGAALPGEFADFFAEFPALGSPGDEDGVGVGFDESEAFGSGFVGVCEEGGGCWGEAGHVTGDDLVYVPLSGESGVPDGVLEVGADGGVGEQVLVLEVGGDLGAGDGGFGGKVGEAFGDGVV